MNQPLVSIIVVSYNHAKFLKENLDSIKYQTYSNIQLIIADDASQDDAVAIYENWLSDNNWQAIKVFNSYNIGLASTLNECIKFVRGKYVKLIAADDFLHPQSIELCVNKLEMLGEDFGMVFTDVYTVDSQSKVSNNFINHQDKSIFKNKNELRYNCLLLANRIIAPTVLVRLKALNETGEYKKDFLLEDYDRWLRIGQTYKIVFIDNKLCYYRRHENNVSSKNYLNFVQEEILLKIKFYQDSFALKKQINFKLAFLLYNDFDFSRELLISFSSFKQRSFILIFLKIAQFNLRIIKKIVGVYSLKTSINKK